MAERKKAVKKDRNEKRVRFSFFSGMDEVKKSNFFKISGSVVAVFALFTLISAVSYLFTWKVDQSLLLHPEMMDKNVEVANWAGKQVSDGDHSLWHAASDLEVSLLSSF